MAERVTTLFPSPGADVRLFFDGPTGAQEILSEQVRVVYSGGEGANRADGAILRDIEFFRKTDGDRTLLLITGDRDFGREAKKCALPCATRTSLPARWACIKSPLEGSWRKFVLSHHPQPHQRQAAGHRQVVTHIIDSLVSGQPGGYIGG